MHLAYFGTHNLLRDLKRWRAAELIFDTEVCFQTRVLQDTYTTIKLHFLVGYYVCIFRYSITIYSDQSFLDADLCNIDDRAFILQV